MKLGLAISVTLVASWCSAIATFAQGPRPIPDNALSSERLQREFFADFNLPSASHDAEQILSTHPGDATALFIRMETAALQQRTEAVLDSALRLCTMPASPKLQEIASSRILENAGNSRVFNEVLRRVGLAMEESNACTFNFRLALVAAAADGATALDLDKTAQSAGLLTHWRIAGPFGQFSNVDFERRWPPESTQFWNAASHLESFWFRDGMVPLPDYFSGNGVFYAESEVSTGANPVSQLDVLSPGPYAISFDGQPVLVKDSRFANKGNRESIPLHLTPGPHRIVVKFTPDAAPFSLDLHPLFARKSGGSLALSKTGEDYVSALLAYFRGNLNEVEEILSSSTQQRGAFLYLRALLWSAAEDHSPRARAAWEALAKEQPSAWLAQIRADESSEVDHRVSNELREQIADLEKQLPNSEAVAQLILKVTRDEPNARAQAVTALLRLHPSCGHLSEALRLYVSDGDLAAATATEQQLARCAPESLDYVRVLSDSGRHREATVLLEKQLAQNPMNRAARKMLVEQLVLSGDVAQAAIQAQALHRIASASRSFARLASDPTLVLDSNSSRATGFVSGNQFYARYRRSGMEAARNAGHESFSGSSVALLLLDRVLQIRADGTASLYAHRVTRLLNKDAIREYGEVTPPRGADLLELRTIKSNGQVIEPELTQQKPAISMPALEPGDSIDEEIVTDYPDWKHLPLAASLFEFGSMAIPVIRTRLLLITPRSSDVKIEMLNAAPEPILEQNANEIVRTWEMENLPAISAEPFSSRDNSLPSVSLSAEENSIDALRDQLVDSTRIGPHVTHAALGQESLPAVDEREKARRLYRFVTGRIESTGSDLSSAAAEDTLASGEGSRTAALLALARATGLKASLLLARRIDHLCAANHQLDCFTEPLVRFFVGDHAIDTDPEVDDLAFGALPPDLDLQGALLIPLNPSNTRGSSDFSSQIVPLDTRPIDEQSAGVGDLFLDSSGNLTATIHVRLGVSRAQAVRTALRTAEERAQQSYFEQLAARLFPGATAVQGKALHLSDPDEPLELSLRCEVPQFVNLQPGPVEITQLAPTLGLRGVFSRSSDRRSNFFLDSVLFESTVFHLHLPPGISAHSLPSDFVTESDFGRYSVRFSQRNGQVDVTREFRIPVQMIAPGRFRSFVEFARQIDEAERRHIVLEMRSTAWAAESAQRHSSLSE